MRRRTNVVDGIFPIEKGIRRQQPLCNFITNDCCCFPQNVNFSGVGLRSFVRLIPSGILLFLFLLGCRK